VKIRGQRAPSKVVAGGRDRSMREEEEEESRRKKESEKKENRGAEDGILSILNGIQDTSGDGVPLRSQR